MSDKPRDNIDVIFQKYVDREPVLDISFEVQHKPADSERPEHWNVIGELFVQGERMRNQASAPALDQVDKVKGQLRRMLSAWGHAWKAGERW